MRSWLVRAKAEQITEARVLPCGICVTNWIDVYVKMLNPLMQSDVKHFKRAELEVARIWLADAT